MKNFVILNAGKCLGLSTAKRFGREGFRAILVARNEEKLKKLVAILKGSKKSLFE